MSCAMLSLMPENIYVSVEYNLCSLQIQKVGSSSHLLCYIQPIAALHEELVLAGSAWTPQEGRRIWSASAPHSTTLYYGVLDS